MIIPIHSPELRALGAVLLAHATPGPVMDSLHCAHMETELGHCIRFAIRVLESKDLPVDVLTVYDYDGFQKLHAPLQRMLLRDKA